MSVKVQACMLWVLLSTLTASGQTQGIINYTLTVNNGIPGSPRQTNYTLSFSGNKSIEFPQKKTDKFNPLIENSERTTVKMIGPRHYETQTVRVINLGNKAPFVYKDFGKNELLLSDNIFITNHLVKDTLHGFEWQITEEQKKIMNYTCTKATTTFRGRDYEAWFTKDIPLSNGPWKFGGLPGLIMEVYDSEKIYKYELSEIDLKAAVHPELIDMPIAYATDKSISHEEFMDMYNTKKQEAKTYRSIYQTKKQEPKAILGITPYGKSYRPTSTIKLAEKIELF
jgi:GLPGLI family protein